MLEELQSCNHEEADYDAFQNGFRIITVDKDVVVIALYHFFHFISMSCVSNLVLVNIENIFQYMKLLAPEPRNFVKQYHFRLH